MPSIWCPKCQFNKKRSALCPQCGFVEEDNSKTYQAPTGIKARTLNGKPQLKSNYEEPKKSYMMTCDVCGNDIAVKATSCPHCGDTKTKNLVWKVLKIIAIVITVMVVIDIILMSFGIALLNEAAKPENVNKIMNKVHQDNVEMMSRHMSKIMPTQPQVTYTNTLKEEERLRQLKIQKQQRELARLQKESEEAKRKLSEQLKQ